MKDKVFDDIVCPIIQAPMAGGITTPELVAEVCNAGMIGSVATGYLSLDACEQFIIKVKSLTNMPYIVNVFIEDSRSDEQVLPKPQQICELEHKLGVYQTNTFLVPATIAEEQYAALLIKYGVPIVSTTFGVFKPEISALLKLNNIKIVANCSSIAEAEYAARCGVDALILQGVEAGGHQAGFLSSDMNQLSTMELFKQVKSLNLSIPLIVTGGINLGNIHKYWQEGVQMVQLGTVFMLSASSALSMEAINYIISYVPKIGTNISNAITGKYARGINNELMQQMVLAEYPFPVQHYATSYLRAQARKINDHDYAGVWLGQHDMYKMMGTQSIIEQLKSLYFDFYKLKS